MTEQQRLKRIKYLINEFNRLAKNTDAEKIITVYRELIILKFNGEIDEDATYQDVLYNNGIEDCIKIILSLDL